ncbi:hypothetical protein [Hymenobacter sp. GOD-10R]|uniref:hypothetical protein n=1 Tax=Hymenobacter sp. GOD-10R TaxID=3093922 RepID=UPI002D79C9D0|nr:hypothetical protein [Hymenobacter sp. GOD-10R]WRQ29838.1 hypothetical protein SD425_06105 [Hymenobacter sp. GOD-10R]
MKKSFFAGLVVMLLGSLLSLMPITTYAQCSLCSSQVESARTEKDAQDFSGLNTGILYLMTIPYLLVGAVGFFWYRYSHQRK